jgi:predicted N-acetyltransferase YhbS
MDGPRFVRQEEVEDLADLLNEVFGFDYYERDYMISRLRRPVSMRGGIGIFEEGKPVSYIFTQDTPFSIFGCLVKISNLGCVCTQEASRNRGFAGAILTHHLRRMEAEGVRILIVSGNRNLYQRHHCVYAGRAWQAAITPGLLPPPPEGLSLRRVTLDDWPELAPIYQAEAAHFVRPAALPEELCFWWNCTNPWIYLIEFRGEPVAYLAASRSRNPEHTDCWTAEYAGARGAIMEALPLILADTGCSVINFSALAQDRDLLYQFRRLGLEMKPLMISGTKRLINLPGLMNDLSPYLTARLKSADLDQLRFDQEGEMCAFSFANERLELDLSDSARLVLGSLETPPVEGELGRVLSAIFPLPTIQSGFNFV